MLLGRVALASLGRVLTTGWLSLLKSENVSLRPIPKKVLLHLTKKINERMHKVDFESRAAEEKSIAVDTAGHIAVVVAEVLHIAAVAGVLHMVAVAVGVVLHIVVAAGEALHTAVAEAAFHMDAAQVEAVFHKLVVQEEVGYRVTAAAEMLGLEDMELDPAAQPDMENLEMAWAIWSIQDAKMVVVDIVAAGMTSDTAVGVKRWVAAAQGIVGYTVDSWLR